MLPRRTDRRASVAIGCSVAGILPAAVLAPTAMSLAAGGTGSAEPTLVSLLFETVFVMGAFGCLGLLKVGRGAARAAVPTLLGLAIVVQLVGAVAGARGSSLLVAQPAVLATALFSWGVGRAAADCCRRSGTATAVAFSLLAASVVSLMALSHVAPALAERPRMAALLISVDPIVAVTSAAGFDLVRSAALYDALSLSGYRFHYADPVWPPLLLAGLGLVLGCARLRSPRAGNRKQEIHLNSPREELTT